MPTVTISTRKATNQFYDEELDLKTHLRMMQIPAGTFLMGSPDNELERMDRESPQHRVSVPSFFMAKYPITQAQWRVVADMPQVNRQLKPYPSNFKRENRPVEKVSWHDAIEFCDRLTAHTKRQYRLPSEAEWEYACRAGTTTPFHFGETISPELANYDSSVAYADGATGKKRGETTPVDYFKIANAWGLCDMHGNVFEWCQDYWHVNYEGAPEDGSSWMTDYSENHRHIVRGGSWNADPRNCRSAYRSLYLPDDRVGSLGFRVSYSAPATL